MIQGFSGGLLNRELIYQTDLPSFQRDFASLKTLDHGTGPSITFTRASNATYFDADGVLQTAANDTPRFDHDPADGSSKGLLIEEARTNSIRNSQAGGAVVGAPGTVPTNWGATSSGTHGITSEVVATGTEAGLSYVDIKLSGTPTSSDAFGFVFEDTYQIVAANAQTWTASIYVKLQGGSLSNITTPQVSVFGLQNGVGFVAAQAAATTLNPTTSSLATNRNSATFTFTSASVDRVRMSYGVSYTNGNPIDLTLRIAAPQLEQGAFATSYIPTTTAAVPRSADSAVVTPISSFYNQSEGTLFAEAGARGIGLVANPILALHNTVDNAITTERWADNRSLATGVNAGGVRQESMDSDVDTWPFGQTVKFSFAYKVNDLARSLNGGSVAVDTTASLPSAATEMTIGQNLLGGRTNGHIRKIAYWPKRLTNTLLEQLAT